jgi:nitroimidazol reductase NimA-like FMN-containing flavoprotein (pyridoxamine 5'-phosphate oxidase superfamily)
VTASFPVSERNKLSRMLRSQKPGVPVCLTVTHLDSLVLARCGFNHSVDYRSAMCFGTAHLVEDPAEKERPRQHGRPFLSGPRRVAAHQHRAGAEGHDGDWHDDR